MKIVKNFYSKGIRISSVLSVLRMAFAFLPMVVSAAENLETTKGVLKTIGNIGVTMGSFLMALSVIVVLYAGFQYMTAAGSEEKVSDATRTLTYAIIGIVVALLAFSVKDIIKSIF